MEAQAYYPEPTQEEIESGQYYSDVMTKGDAIIQTMKEAKDGLYHIKNTDLEEYILFSLSNYEVNEVRDAGTATILRVHHVASLGDTYLLVHSQNAAI